MPTIAYNPLNPSQEWQRWREYFERYLQWVPVVMRRMIDRAPDAIAAMTVPALLPETFDRSFQHDPAWKPATPRLVTPRELRDSLERLKARYGPNWGIKQMPGPGHARKPWTPPTDDELRARYGKRHDEPEPGVEF